VPCFAPLSDINILYNLLLKDENMRWKEEAKKQRYFEDLMRAEEIVYHAYKEGFINWNSFTKVREKINSNWNSIHHRGIFVPNPIKKENYGKPIEDWD
jgi:hypothetical protein